MRRLRHPAIERQSVPLFVWGLFVAVLILGAVEAVVGVYLNDRRLDTDRRDAAQGRAICEILNQFPPGANRALDDARIVYKCRPHPKPPKH